MTQEFALLCEEVAQALAIDGNEERLLQAFKDSGCTVEVLPCTREGHQHYRMTPPVGMDGLSLELILNGDETVFALSTPDDLRPRGAGPLGYVAGELVS